MNYYSRYTRTILNSGTKITPRGLPVIAKYNVTFATVPGFTYRREKDNPLIGFMEGLQLDEHGRERTQPRLNRG